MTDHKFDEEIFLKDKLENLLNVTITHNTNGNDPPDLEFELDGKQIGIEVMCIMKDMGDDTSIKWLNDNLRKTIEPCLEEFEKKYARIIRSKGETRCFALTAQWGDFRERADASKETFNAIRDSIQKTITQGLKVFFRLPEVEKERFFSDKMNLWELREFWRGNLPGCSLDGGMLEGILDGHFIAINDGFDLSIISGGYRQEIPVPDDKLFDNYSSLWTTDQGGAMVDTEFAHLHHYIQRAIYKKREKCINKLGSRKEDQYDEMWLYLYDEVSRPLPHIKPGQVEAMSFDFGKYWSKVCLYTTLLVPNWCISLKNSHT